MARDRQRAKQRRAQRRSGHPDPLDHASAEVDEARLAEAGAAPPVVGEGVGEIYADELEDERAERAPDAVEGDAVSHRGVQWPNRRQVGQATAVVLGFVVIAGGYLGLLDAIWQPLIEAIL